jgi:hypothetical protein
MAEQQSNKPSVDFSSLDTAEGLNKSRICANQAVDQHTFVTFNDYPKKTEGLLKAPRKKGYKKNILEDMSFLDNSLYGDDHIYESESEDERNYDELKNMITDMND